MTVTGQSWAVIVVEFAVVEVVVVEALVVVEVVWSWAGKEQLLVSTAETADCERRHSEAKKGAGKNAIGS